MTNLEAARETKRIWLAAEARLTEARCPLLASRKAERAALRLEIKRLYARYAECCGQLTDAERKEWI